VSFYAKMQATATKLLTKFQQGSISYVSQATSGDPWNPQPGAETVTPLTATAAGVSKEYVDGKLVVATDLEITAAVFGIVPGSTPLTVTITVERTGW